MILLDFCVSSKFSWKLLGSSQKPLGSQIGACWEPLGISWELPLISWNVPRKLLGSLVPPEGNLAPRGAALLSQEIT